MGISDKDNIQAAACKHQGKAKKSIIKPKESVCKESSKLIIIQENS